MDIQYVSWMLNVIYFFKFWMKIIGTELWKLGECSKKKGDKKLIWKQQWDKKWEEKKEIEEKSKM